MLFFENTDYLPGWGYLCDSSRTDILGYSSASILSILGERINSLKVPFDSALEVSDDGSGQILLRE